MENEEIKTKVCKNCKIEKELNAFSKHKDCLHGVNTTCKSCINKEEKVKRRLATEKEKSLPANGLKVCGTCKTEKSINEFSQKADKKDGLMNRCKKCVSQHYYRNKDSLTASHKIYYENNKSVINSYKNEWIKTKRNLDPSYKLSSNISALLRGTLKRKNITKNSKSQDILGCTIEGFKAHIESQFLNWMNWENYGDKCQPLEYNCSWDLDHIIPISYAKTEEEIYLLNHWSNFQPLCSKINRDEKKSSIYSLTNLELQITIIIDKENESNT